MPRQQLSLPSTLTACDPKAPGHRKTVAKLLSSTGVANLASALSRKLVGLSEIVDPLRHCSCWKTGLDCVAGNPNCSGILGARDFTPCQVELRIEFRPRILRGLTKVSSVCSLCADADIRSIVVVYVDQDQSLSKESLCRCRSMDAAGRIKDAQAR